MARQMSLKGNEISQFLLCILGSSNTGQYLMLSYLHSFS